MESRLGALPDVIEQLRFRSDPELLSCIEATNPPFLGPYEGPWRTLSSTAITATAAGRSSLSRNASRAGRSILIRDEGTGFDTKALSSPKDLHADEGLGIHLVRSSMDTVEFRKNGTEFYLRMKERLERSAKGRYHD